MKKSIWVIFLLLSCSIYTVRDGDYRTRQVAIKRLPLKMEINNSKMKTWVMKTSWELKGERDNVLAEIKKGRLFMSKDKLYWEFTYHVTAKGWKPHSHYQGFIINLYNKKGKKFETLKFGIWIKCSFLNRKMFNRQDLHPLSFKGVHRIEVYPRPQLWYRCKR
ncbi:hypothetical protein ACFL20_13060 [Spirochaetota bacterium]